MLGVDVSNNNGRIDWKALRKAGVRFAFLKATEGRTYDDSYYTGNLRDCRVNGIRAGAYHYARPDLHSAVSEAQHFLERIRPYKGTIVPALDFEEMEATLSPNRLTAWARTWLEQVGAELDCTPIFYSFPWYISSKMGGAEGLGRWPLWLASYGPNDGTRHHASPVGPWRTIAVHQYSSRGRLAGRELDVNRADPQTLDRLAYPARTPPPAPTPEPSVAPYLPWKEWRLGEGHFHGAGPANPKARPAEWQPRVPWHYWLRLRLFLLRRRLARLRKRLRQRGGNR